MNHENTKVGNHENRHEYSFVFSCFRDFVIDFSEVHPGQGFTRGRVDAQLPTRLASANC